ACQSLWKWVTRYHPELSSFVLLLLSDVLQFRDGYTDAERLTCLHCTGEEKESTVYDGVCHMVVCPRPARRLLRLAIRDRCLLILQEPQFRSSKQQGG